MRQFVVLLRAAAALLLTVSPTLALAAETKSGLPLPRFVTTRSTQINVRLGPGFKYDIAWVYKVAGTPVEIIQEYDIWRKIRDFDGSEGWVQQNMLSGVRGGYVIADTSTDRIGLRTGASDDAGIVAWVGPGFPVKIQSCESGWCSVVATDHPPSGRATAYAGYLQEGELWGVYQGESFD